MAEIMTDYQTMLADMEAKKALLEQAITSLRAAIAAGALGPISGDLPLGSPPIIPTSGPPGGDIPKGAFFGKSIPEAILVYLATVRKKCTIAEIAQGLKKGGIESLSKTFEIVVRNTMYRLKADGKVLLFDDGWALAEWYPEGLRSRVEQKNKGQDKKRGGKKKTKAVSERPTSATTRPKTLVENYFSTHLGSEVSAKELAGILNMDVRGVNLILSQLFRKGWLQKAPNGRFIRTSKVTPISKTA